MSQSAFNPQAVQDYQVITGLDNMTGALETLASYVKTHPDHPQKYVFLYQLNSQKSLLMVDVSQAPFKFYYNDLQGRPITEGLKKTLAAFLTKEFDLSANATDLGQFLQPYLKDYRTLSLYTHVQATTENKVYVAPAVIANPGKEEILAATEKLNRAINGLEWDKLANTALAKSVSMGREPTFATSAPITFFKPGTVSPTPDKNNSQEPNVKPPSKAT